MELRNQVEWALHCCTVLSACAPEEKLSTKALAEFHGVPKEYLSKALQALASAGLVTGSLGPTGGYRLARPAEKITMLEIVEAIEGTKKTFRCEEIRGNNPCLSGKAAKPKGVCAIARAMYRADEAWRKELKIVTLADIRGAVAKDVSAEILDASAAWLRAR